MEKFEIIIVVMLVVVMLLCYPKKDEIYLVTAYCPCKKCCGDGSYGITASGHHIDIGIQECFVAALFEFLFGTMVIIEGYNSGKPVPVLDRGGDITKKRFDVYFDSHEEAVEWGKQYLKVKVLK